MTRFFSLASTLVLSLVLGTTSANAAQTTQPTQAITTTATAETEANLDYMLVLSPYGYSAWYWVHPGWNTLICPGTGLAFHYFH